MSRWLLTLLALSAVTVAVVLAVARPGALSRPGTFAQPVAAIADAEPSATPWAYIDKLENGDGWCDPDHIDSTTTEYVGGSHQLAICVDNLPGAVHSFTAAISYDGALDQCIDKECHILDSLRAQGTIVEACLDDNPDANAGETTWPPDSEGLGTGWTCSPLPGDQYQAQYLLSSEPICTLPLLAMPAPSKNTAWIHCEGSGDYQFGGEGEWGALAVLDLNVIGAGTDNVSISDLEVSGGEYTLTCPLAAAPNGDSLTTIPSMPCQGATDIKREQEHHRSKPTPTPAPPTATPVPPTVPPPPPPPTATPSGGVGPEIVAPATGSGPSDSGAPWAVWLAIAVAGPAAAAGGFYLRFAKGRRRGSR
jgi:hypothetical protein